MRLSFARVSYDSYHDRSGATATCRPADCKTYSSGQVSFTYSVPVAPSSLGSDTITASVTLADPTGATDTEQVTKTWADTTAPVLTCTPTTNPSGGNVPPAGNNPKSGQGLDVKALSRSRPNGYPTLSVMFFAGSKVTAVVTTSREQRTVRGIGVGSTEAAVRSRLAGARCEEPGNGMLHCHVGRLLPGRVVTDLALLHGRVVRVTVGYVID